jgi:hypothetical protein
MALPEQWRTAKNYPSLVALNSAARSGAIQGFICESFATIEAIAKGRRASFHAEKKPIVNVKSKPAGLNLLCMTIQIETDHSLHPGLPKDFKEELNEALALGLKLLSTPYLNHPIPERLLQNRDAYAPEVFATSTYNERFGQVSSAIEARGVGWGAIAALEKELTSVFESIGRKVEIPERELISRVYDAVCASGDKRNKAKIEKAFAESADGDTVAAHIAFGNDYLCTEDHGRSAVGPSIFNASNRAWLKATYGVEIVSAENLLTHLT